MYLYLYIDLIYLDIDVDIYDDRLRKQTGPRPIGLVQRPPPPPPPLTPHAPVHMRRGRSSASDLCMESRRAATAKAKYGWAWQERLEMAAPPLAKCTT